MVNTDGNYLIHDLVNFEGLAVKAEKGVKITFYSDPLNNNTTYKAKKDYVIAPYATEEKDGFVYYYLPNITGLYCYEASKTGYYTSLYVNGVNACLRGIPQEHGVEDLY